MKKVLLMSILITFMMMPKSAFGALSPAFYKSAQAKSSDVVVVKIEKVLRYRKRYNRLYVKAWARVLSVQRSSRRLRDESRIIIHYKTYSRLSRGTLGGAPIGVLRRGHVYRAYLKRDRHSRFYIPSAGNRSLIPLGLH